MCRGLQVPESLVRGAKLAATARGSIRPAAASLSEWSCELYRSQIAASQQARSTPCTSPLLCSLHFPPHPPHHHHHVRSHLPSSYGIDIVSSGLQPIHQEPRCRCPRRRHAPPVNWPRLVLFRDHRGRLRGRGRRQWHRPWPSYPEAYSRQSRLSYWRRYGRVRTLFFFV